MFDLILVLLILALLVGGGLTVHWLLIIALIVFLFALARPGGWYGGRRL